MLKLLFSCPQALLVKDVPATKEVLSSLPNVFSALCLNTRGLDAFVACKPFERLFKVLLSPDYLPAMRRRRSSDPMGDTAANLGSAMDELMRHQPSLKTAATTAIIKLLEEVCALGNDPKYVCWKSSASSAKQDPSAASSVAQAVQQQVRYTYLFSNTQLVMSLDMKKEGISAILMLTEFEYGPGTVSHF